MIETIVAKALVTGVEALCEQSLVTKPLAEHIADAAVDITIENCTKISPIDDHIAYGVMKFLGE
jgi:hypothetical protein